MHRDETLRNVTGVLAALSGVTALGLVVYRATAGGGMQCVACRKWIDPAATVCAHCRSAIGPSAVCPEGRVRVM
jgi:hypothetical protein